MASPSNTPARHDPPFRLRVENSALWLGDEPDLAGMAEFERCVADAGPVVVCDLSPLPFVGTGGLILLVLLERMLRDIEAVLVLRNPQPAVERVLDVAGLTWLLERRSPNADSPLEVG